MLQDARPTNWVATIIKRFIYSQSVKDSMDPVNLVTRAGSVEHTRSGEFLNSEVVAPDRKLFRSNLRLDDTHWARFVEADPRHVLHYEEGQHQVFS